MRAGGRHRPVGQTSSNESGFCRGLTLMKMESCPIRATRLWAGVTLDVCLTCSSRVRRVPLHLRVVATVTGSVFECALLSCLLEVWNLRLTRPVFKMFLGRTSHPLTKSAIMPTTLLLRLETSAISSISCQPVLSLPAAPVPLTTYPSTTVRTDTTTGCFWLRVAAT